jgi:hypothetical protein
MVLALLAMGLVPDPLMNRYRKWLTLDKVKCRKPDAPMAEE